MNLRQEASLGIGSILALQLFLSMFAIALLVRMGPAIERILEENVYSSQAIEVMMASLAMSLEPSPVPKDFDDALQRAKNNVTEEPERPLLAVIERRRQAAFAAEPEARRETIAALQQLGQVNIDSMIRADAKAQRLGQAGAWAAALLGALALALGIVIYRRLRLRLELPIEQLRRTAEQVRAGNVQARCSSNAGPQEVRQIAADFNWMLDRWVQEKTSLHDEQREAEVRRALMWLLDREPLALAVFDAQGKKVTANRAAMLLDTPLQDSQNGDAASDPWTVEEIPGTSLRFARFVQTSDEGQGHNA